MHYLFLLPALLTSAYLAEDTYCVLKIVIVKEPEDALAWSVLLLAYGLGELELATQFSTRTNVFAKRPDRLWGPST